MQTLTYQGPRNGCGADLKTSRSADNGCGVRIMTVDLNEKLFFGKIEKLKGKNEKNLNLEKFQLVPLGKPVFPWKY